MKIRDGNTNMVTLDVGNVWSVTSGRSDVFSLSIDPLVLHNFPVGVYDSGQVVASLQNFP